MKRLFAGLNPRGHRCDHDHRTPRAAAQCSARLGRNVDPLIAAWSLDGDVWVLVDASTAELREAAKATKARSKGGAVPFPELAIALRDVTIDALAAACQVSRTRAVHVKYGHARLRPRERNALVRRRLARAADIDPFVRASEGGRP